MGSPEGKGDVQRRSVSGSSVLKVLRQSTVISAKCIYALTTMYQR